MTILDLSTLNAKNTSDLYYMESLSFDNLPQGGISNISNIFLKSLDKSFKAFDKYFSETLPIFNARSQNPSFSTQKIHNHHYSSSIDLSLQPDDEDIVFQAHDLHDVRIKINQKDGGFINFDATGHSFVNQEEYDIHVLFEGLSNYKCELAEYAKGQKLYHRECDFSSVYDKYDFMFRDVLFDENSKLEPEIQFLFIAMNAYKYTDFGERKVLSLSFTPEKLDFTILNVLQNQSKNKKKFR